MKIKEYFWIYNKYNDNIYILIFIIILLVSFINIFNLYKKKPKSTIKFVKSKFDNTISPSTTSISPSTTSPVSTKYQAPIITNLSNNLFISNDEQAKYKIAKSLLDGNEDSLQNTNGSPNSYMNLPQNDILQMDSTLFTPMYTVNSSSGSIIGNYATLDSLGTGLTDTLGGVNSSLGYAILDEQLGTFNQPNFTNPHVYDNMQTYNTGINANTISGVNTSLDMVLDIVVNFYKMKDLFFYKKILKGLLIYLHLI